MRENGKTWLCACSCAFVAAVPNLDSRALSHMTASGSVCSKLGLRWPNTVFKNGPSLLARGHLMLAPVDIVTQRT